MFARLMRRWALLEGETGDAPAGGAPAAAPAADAVAAPAADPALTPPASLLSDKPDDAPADKPADDKPADQPVDDKPIEYTDFNVPEGLALDADKLGAFKDIAAAAKMPQDVAQKLVDLYTADVKALSEAPMRAWTEMQNQWQEAVRNDPVIGGANLDKNLAATKAGLNNLLGEDAPKFFEALSFTGAGNNPDIIRGLFKAAQPHAPATPVAGSPGKPTKSAGTTLYPNMAGLGNGHEG
jgi:hypothetical protein